jgi:signal transduction histidine kinase
MDLSGLSNRELNDSLQALQRNASGVPPESIAQLQEAVQELQVHRIELEMQNRALRESQAELELALRRYSDLYDHLPIGYVMLTRKGRIVQGNLTAAEWLRRARDQLAGVYMSWFLDAFDAGRFAAHLEACHETGAPMQLDVTMRIEGGLLLTVQLSSRLGPAEPGGERLIHTAITNIARIRQAQQIVEDMNREQQAISGSLSQEMRAPLATISGQAQLLLREHAGALDPAVKSIVERIECAAVRLEATLQQLLDYTIGGEAPSLDPVNLDELVQAVLVEHRALVDQRQADIVVARPLPAVRGSRLVLGHVISNLLVEALRQTATDPSPELRISAGAEGDTVRLQIAVAPNGSPAADETSFRTFERVPGGGVLVALAHRAVERMNGRVWLDAGAARSVCFNVALPKL